MNNTENKNIKDWYLAGFNAFEKKLNGESNTFLHEIRHDALRLFSSFDFPTNRNEEWKYTNISPILKHNFNAAVNSKLPKFSKKDIEKYIFDNFDCHLIVFVNGIYSEELSKIGNLPGGITIGNLRKIVNENPQFVNNYLTRLSKVDNAFNAINTAFSYDGLAVIVPDGKIVEKPVQVLYLNVSGEELIFSHPRNLIIAGKNSQVSIISNYSGYDNSIYLSNVVTEIFIDENAAVSLCKIQDESHQAFHIEKVQTFQKKNSVFNHYNIGFGGSIVRNDINTLLDDENTETHYYGLYLAAGEQHVDNHTFIDHANPNCTSNELYKGILDNNSHGVFNGKIIVRKDAQKTNAYQQNKTILLSQTAKIDTKPQLEIFANDVKCSHGATIGKLDESSEFYIRSRGVPQEIAKSMLIRAFANDVIETIKIVPLREQLNHMIFEHLHRAEINNK